MIFGHTTRIQCPRANCEVEVIGNSMFSSEEADLRALREIHVHLVCEHNCPVNSAIIEDYDYVREGV